MRHWVHAAYTGMGLGPGKARECTTSHLLTGKGDLTILQSDDASHLLAELRQKVLLGAHGQHALLARRQPGRRVAERARQHHVRARALEQQEHLLRQETMLLMM